MSKPIDYASPTAARVRDTLRKGPHPNPPPEYQERGQIRDVAGGVTHPRRTRFRDNISLQYWPSNRYHLILDKGIECDLMANR